MSYLHIVALTCSHLSHFHLARGHGFFLNHVYPNAPRPPAGRRPPEWARQRLSKYADAKTLYTQAKIDPFDGKS
jgi:hypothetical protein